jgi:hypothetical protein
MTFSAPLLGNRGILAADMLNLSAGTSLNNSGLLQGDSGLTLTTALLNNLTGGKFSPPATCSLHCRHWLTAGC